MFRSADSETEAVALNYEWSLRMAPPQEIVHICGPAYSSTCLAVDEGGTRLARCERCGAQIAYTTLARLLRRGPGGPA